MITQIERREALSDPIERYRRMFEIRVVEERIQRLYEDGYVRGSTHLGIGQEAVAVGIASATRATDTITATYRGHGIALAAGVTPEGVLGEICGRAIGCAGGIGGSMHLYGEDVGLLPTFAIVGAGIPIAAGAALAAKLRHTDHAAVAIFGDGTCNIGAFHEALNLAAIWRLPVVFVIENNLYGEYTRIQLSTPIEDLAGRATGYAMSSAVIDGQDSEAVIGAMDEAIAAARGGDGPTLLEMKTYRYSGHSRADPATYRPVGELDAWRARDPLDICAARLVSDGNADESHLDHVRRAVTTSIDEAIETVLASDPPELQEILRHTDGATAALGKW